MKRWRKDGHGCLLADQKCLSTPQSTPRQTWRRFRSWRSRASANRSGAADYIAGRKQDFQWDRIREGFAHHADQRKSLTRCCLGRERHQSVKVGTRHHGLHRTGGAVGRSAIPSPILGGDTPPDASIVEEAAVRSIAPQTYHELPQVGPTSAVNDLWVLCILKVHTGPAVVAGSYTHGPLKRPAEGAVVVESAARVPGPRPGKAASGIGPSDPTAGRGPPQNRTSPIKAFGSSKCGFEPVSMCRLVLHTVTRAQVPHALPTTRPHPDRCLRYSRAPVGRFPRFQSLLCGG
jgi:hypothetical protein